MTVTLPVCRTDAANFFSKSDYYYKGARWPHYPVIAFVETGDGVDVQLLDTASKVSHSTLPDDTRCLQQWGGQWKSDFIAFTLGEARAALA